MTPATIERDATRAALLRWVETSGDAWVATDADGRIVRANAAFGRAFALAEGTCGTPAPPDRDVPAASDERPVLSRFVPLLSAPRLRRWLAESSAAPAGGTRVHRLIAESTGADGDRFLAAVTLLPVATDVVAPAATGRGIREGGAPARTPTGAATACLVALRPLDGPRGLHPGAAGPSRRAGAVEVVEVAAVVDAALRALEGVGARLRCGLALRVGDARIGADPAAVREALVRVLDNACRYSPADAPIRVRARVEPADPAEGGDAVDRVVVTVADRGPGLARADVQRVFEPFWRGPATRGVPGQGLGLPVARALLEGQRGWIELRSAPGIGTEVELWLPAARADAEAAPDDAGAAETATPGT